MTKLRLGINIDHVATIRNARGGQHPDPVRAAKLARSLAHHPPAAGLAITHARVFDSVRKAMRR